jgi:thiol-disulfide isomerase/thioredoxin
VADPEAPRPGLVLYSRQYCHLCDDMLAALEALRDELVFGLEVIDVDAEPELERRYNELVPVLMHGERELARWRLDTSDLRAYLRNIS